MRPHLIEASGTSEAWYVPSLLLARCGLAGEGRVLALGGWVGETWATAAFRRCESGVGEKEGFFECFAVNQG